jgi:hypothetical protein
MNEAEWLTCTDPTPMLQFVRGTVGERKLRLFACACCRRLHPLLTNQNSQQALETAEHFADGEEGRRNWAWLGAKRGGPCKNSLRQRHSSRGVWTVPAMRPAWRPRKGSRYPC